ncbi:MAG TPA: 23S rRNA (guanosine(2251)-2'-O)-methyltransferase RlmB [Pseudonocardiaceae bacterium]|jgi:23S rRNA (guanosine2251-2'-O)-methyltransferase|nr:23S rRNA (guanosine(2251)-2'-O)-methyltransferase RlmB [Pseudonocardiaceae bacterium]
MAGNSRRRGALRKPGTKKGAVIGSGGQQPKGLRGRGATPPAELRPGHPAQRQAQRRAAGQGGDPARRGIRRRADIEAAETVFGRNPVLECLRARVPATALQVAVGVDLDDRVREAVQLAADAGLAVLEVPRADLDRMAAGGLHQGVALQVPPYRYAHPDDLLAAALESPEPALLVALDGVTDPRNLGAVVRSAAAFGAHGLLLPQRRSAGMTAVAWRTSAGTAAHLPMARATNLTRTLKDWAAADLMVVGLAADGSLSLDSFPLASGPLVVVLGAEGRGLSRLVRQTCDATVSIPMPGPVESLNASVAAGIVLAEIARLRRGDQGRPVSR